MGNTKIIVPGRCSAFAQLNRLLKSRRYAGCRFVIVVDDNTRTHCLPSLIAKVSALQHTDFLEVPIGEEAKSIEVATRLWSALQGLPADRHTVLLNLGGGCVCDLGGFVAASYMRGIRYINVPSTLLAMVDASIGGKTALNLHGVKNPIGFVHLPDAIVVEPALLATLDDAELRSGLFELLKTLMLCHAEGYRSMRRQILAKDFTLQQDTIALCATFKAAVAKQDPNDHGIRHMLNLGHTFGHAIESHSHAGKATATTPLSHGEAVGIGMACALYLSVHKLGFPRQEYEQYLQMLHTLVAVPRYTLQDTEPLLALMHRDKKNSGGRTLCVLLQTLATPVIDVAVDDLEIRDALLKVCQ